MIPNATTTFDYTPLAGLSEGSNLRMHSLFVNDNWRVNGKLTLNVGLRMDKNDATDGDGDLVGDDLSFSPRVSAVWDPIGDGRWALSGSFARYTMALTSNVVASTAVGGNAATSRWIYTGAPINADPNAPTESLMTTDAVLRSVFAWHESLGGNNRAASLSNLPGVNMKIDEPLSSPYSMEYSTGLARSLGDARLRSRRRRLPRLPQLLRHSHRSSRPGPSPTRRATGSISAWLKIPTAPSASTPD